MHISLKLRESVPIAYTRVLLVQENTPQTVQQHRATTATLVTASKDGITTMMIDSNNSLNTATSGAKSRAPATEKPATGANPDAGSSPQASDVSLSNRAQQLSRLEAQVSNSPDVDSDRVAELQKAIADGTFNIDPERIADKMLQQDDVFG